MARHMVLVEIEDGEVLFRRTVLRGRQSTRLEVKTRGDQTVMLGVFDRERIPEPKDLPDPEALRKLARLLSDG